MRRHDRAAGASGYLLDDRLHEELAPALRAVVGGGTRYGGGAGAPG